MNTQTIPTEPARSLLFPDLSPEDFAEAQRLAVALAVPSMPADADDVLLAMHIVKETRRGGVDYRPHYWVVRDVRGKMIGNGHSEAPLGGCTLADAKESLRRHERRD